MILQDEREKKKRPRFSRGLRNFSNTYGVPATISQVS
jgi:hypothetical protein